MSTTSTYTVQGMTCGSCATKVSSAVSQVGGVTGTDVDISTGTLTVAGPDVDQDAVRRAITDAGYQLG
jgi:copper chaperone CopZ